MQEETKHNTKKTNKLYRKIFISLFTLFLFLFEFFTRNFLKQLSITYFFSSDQSRCSYFVYTDYLEKGIKYFMIYLTYNIVNVYSALTIVFVDTLSVVVSHNMKLIYKDDRPFINDTTLLPCQYTSSYGNPSASAMSLFLIFGTFYQAMKQKRNSKENRIICISIWIICVFYSCYVRLLQNVIYLNQIILGIGLGFTVYYIMFRIMKINFNEFKQIAAILNNYTFTILFVIIFFLFNTFIQFTLSEPFISNPIASSYMKTLTKVFSDKDQSLFLNNVNYIMSTKLFEFLGFYIGLLLEYLVVFKKNEDMFIRYNIKEINQNGEEMFNHTSYDITIFRIILFCVCHFYLHPNVNVDTIDTSSYLNLLLSLPIVERMFIGVLIFFVLKYAMKFIGVTNEKMFHKEKY